MLTYRFKVHDEIERLLVLVDELRDTAKQVQVRVRVRVRVRDELRDTAKQVRVSNSVSTWVVH